MAYYHSSKKHPKEISGVIGKLIHSLGLTSRYNGWTVVAKWPEIVGNEIANQAKAIRYHEGTLYVAVPDSAWRQQLSMQVESLRDKIRGLPYGKSVKEIRLVQGEKGI